MKPKRVLREGVEKDFLSTSVPGNLGALVGHGVNGTCLLLASEVSHGCHVTPMSGDLPFLVRAPNMFFIVAPMELRSELVGSSSGLVGLASKHFW
jgi:hypothetical protein